jgi:hypothetical protein
VINLRTGLATGLRAGLAIGLQADPLRAANTSMAGVAQDATSGKFLPANTTQWNTTMAAAGLSSGNPSALHLLQEASGNPADAIGSITLTASGTLAYQQAASGWSTKGIGTSTGVAGLMQSVSASLPNISTTSMLALVYALVPATAATFRSLFQFGPTFGSQAAALIGNSTNKKLRGVADPNFVDGVDDASAVVRPFVLKVNRTGAAAALYSDAEKLAPTLTATPTGKGYALGGDNTMSFFPDAFTFLYSAVFFGAAAELSDAQVRTLLQTLGWMVAW